MVTPHPVGDVQGSVEAEEEQVVGGDGFRLARLGDHEELRHYGHRLQENGEGPQDLGGMSVKGTDEGLKVQNEKKLYCLCNCKFINPE